MDYLTTMQAAAELGITQEGVQKLIQRKVVRAELVGGMYLIRRKEVEKAKGRRGRGQPKKGKK